MNDTHASAIDASIASANTADAVDVELSIVMPCLNEHETVGKCVRKAVAAIKSSAITAEIIVADNGSTDGSQEIAAREGARVVAVAARGYGSALIGGINAARGKFILMGDADDSYDFGEAPRFVELLRTGCDLVQGCRLPSGGGIVKPGAMPWLHRWIGNPGLTWLARTMFRVPFNDVYCGMRAFRKDFYERLSLRSPGMEFATEMIVKSALFGGMSRELPITLWPDGRVTRRPHLRTFRDGWRTLRLYLIYSPRWLFWYPGIMIMIWGLAGALLGLAGAQVGGVTFGSHTLLISSMMITAGFQAACFAIVTSAYSIAHGYRPPSARVARFLNIFTLERTLVGGFGAIALGVALIAATAIGWASAEFGPLDYAKTMRVVIPSVSLVLLGTTAVFCGFLNAVVGTRESPGCRPKDS